MKKILIALSLLIALPALAYSTLWEFYQGNLPTVSERQADAQRCGIEDYRGTAEQNNKLLACLESGTKSGLKLGASFQTPEVRALFETTLASAISSSATSFTLTSATDIDGTALASSTYAFIIDEGTSVEEFVLADSYQGS